MIGWLSGVVRERDPLSGHILLDVGGVGYQVLVSWQTFVEVPEVEQPCSLWIHTHVREDVLALYGFASPQERRMFQLLTSVPQVGPRNAISVLGGFPLTELLAAIAEGERATLERIPGVGKRTAERILLDLREKVEPLREALGTGVSGTPPPPLADADDALRNDARAVLVNLGWKAKVVDSALDKALAPTDGSDVPDDLDSLVRQTLARLMAR
jgi:Holliday junction DNA helicase RuvA